MSEVAKFISLLSAGVPLGQATNLIDFEKFKSSPSAMLVEDVKRFGSPIALVGNRIIDFEAEVQKFESELAQAGSVPRQTRNLLLWLPAFSLVLGQLSGFGTFPALLKPIGMVAVLVAGILIWAGIRWSSRMLAELNRPSTHPALGLMRLGIAVRSGQAINAIDRDLTLQAEPLLTLTKTTGAPLTKLIDAEIQARTTSAILSAMSEAKAMSVKLLVPMGLTVLPAFFILTIVPMFLGIGF